MMMEDTGKSSNVNAWVNTTILFTTLILVQNDEDICHNIMQEPIVNLSHSQS